MAPNGFRADLRGPVSAIISEAPPPPVIDTSVLNMGGRPRRGGSMGMSVIVFFLNCLNFEAIRDQKPRINCIKSCRFDLILDDTHAKRWFIAPIERAIFPI